MSSWQLVVAKSGPDPDTTVHFLSLAGSFISIISLFFCQLPYKSFVTPNYNKKEFACPHLADRFESGIVGWACLHVHHDTLG